MAVYEQTYRRYQGELTSRRTRLAVIPRYAFREVFKSRLFTTFFVLCFAMPFVAMIMIYLHHNLSFLKMFNLPLTELKQFLPIDNAFFHRGIWFQGVASALLVLFVGPALIAPDLRNNGLALYLSRPISRAEYLLGKMSVLLGLLSAITWVPGLLLFLFQSYLEGGAWLASNLRIAMAIFVGSLAWIVTLSLLALTVSAWVKWKPVARISLMAILFVSMGFAGALSNILNSRWPWVISLWHVIASVWAGLFGVGDSTSNIVPLGAAWVALAVLAGACLFLLSQRLKAYEVVR
jgi:ABC-2 type transport system permease protein